MTESRVAALLRRHGVDTPRLSIRAAAQRCRVSSQTMSKIMRGEIRRVRDTTRDKIVRGLGVPLDELSLAILQDARLVEIESGSDVAEVLARIEGLSSGDLARIQIAVGQMQQERAAEQEMRGGVTSAE